MSGNELTSEGTPRCCLFPKMNQSKVTEQRTCWLQLKAACLFCIMQEDPWGLHVGTGPEASVSHPALFPSLCASSHDPWHGLSAPLPGILSRRCYLCRDPATPSRTTPHPLLTLTQGMFPALVFLRAPAPVWYEAPAAPGQWFCLLQCMEPRLAQIMNSHDNKLE